MPGLRALLVGVNAYPVPVPPLTGCVNDVQAMAQTLVARVPQGDLQLLVLTDEQATRRAVTGGILAVVGAAALAVLHSRLR